MFSFVIAATVPCCNLSKNSSMFNEKRWNNLMFDVGYLSRIESLKRMFLYLLEKGV